MIEKIKIFLDDLFKVSKLTKTKNKKLRIFSIALISNIIVLMDILIILSFTNIFTEDVGINNSLINTIFDNNMYLVVIIGIRFLSIYFEKVNISKLRLEIEENLRDDLLDEIFDQGNYSSSDAYFYINTISGQVASFYGTLATFMSSFLQVFAYSFYLIFTDLQNLMYLFFGALILYIPTLFIVRRGRQVSHKTYESSQDISSDIEKIVDNLHLIKILNLANKELKNFRNDLKIYYGSTLENVKLGTINALIPNFLTLFSLGILIVFVDIVKFVTLDFIGVALRLFQSLGTLNSNLHLVSAYHVYLEKLFYLKENRANFQKNNFEINSNLENENAIKFEDVDFCYFNSDTYIFENLNLNIKRNKHTVITGPNGSGKSTLLGLLSGIYYPMKGKVISFSANYGYVGANPMIINDTLKENLLYGNNNPSKVSDNNLIQLIDQFKVFNETKENILDSQVSNKTLSTGQMQKIAFIRALLNNLDILLLDEALSNVDKLTKETILNVINNMEITVINITHNILDYTKYDYHLKIELHDEKRKIIKSS
tara:strand:- start:3911 stop:5536 length:1626 start_codon:yes stop_codon:yes gene_type:complete